jgi:hypothetical protein
LIRSADVHLQSGVEDNVQLMLSAADQPANPQEVHRRPAMDTDQPEALQPIDSHVQRRADGVLITL